MYEHNPRRAAQLLEELGYARGPDGAFRDAANQSLSVEMRTTAQLQVQTKAIFPVANYWQGIGVNVDTVLVPIQRITDREYRATFPAFELITAGNSLTSSRIKLFHSVNTARSENGFQANGNYARYINPELDSLIDRYAATIPKAERLQVLGQIARHQSENLSLLPLFHTVGPTIAAARLKDLRPGVGNLPWNAYEWSVS
jgi:ABC-type transport system substrate-binding protein